ncbi:MAG: transposase, partial [Vicinamibacterales bacterium]
LLSLGKRRHSVKLFGVCVMPNHFHALVRPEEEGALSAYFQSVQCCYACYFRSRTQTVGNGHVFQRRFWSAQIQDDYHFLNVLRYIEANPIAGDLVVRAEEWPWSSATLRPRAAVVLDTLPLRLPLEWSEMVHNDAHELPL